MKRKRHDEMHESCRFQGIAVRQERRGIVTSTNLGAPIMSKAKDTQKAVKKEPAKSMKEKKAAKQAKKSEKTKFTPQ
jgi:septum formation inhibitor-activating ATPase MinD